jgi:hypothetical protein
MPVGATGSSAGAAKPSGSDANKNVVMGASALLVAVAAGVQLL